MYGVGRRTRLPFEDIKHATREVGLRSAVTLSRLADRSKPAGRELASRCSNALFRLKRQVRPQIRSRDLPRDLQANVSDLAKRLFRGFPCFGVAHVVQKLVPLPSQPVKPRKAEANARR